MQMTEKNENHKKHINCSDFQKIANKKINKSKIKEEYNNQAIKDMLCNCKECQERKGTNITTELLPLDTQIPLQIMANESAMLCKIL